MVLLKNSTGNPNIVAENQTPHGCNNTCYSDIRSEVSRVSLTATPNGYPTGRHGFVHSSEA